MVRWPYETRTSGRIFRGHLAARFMVIWPREVLGGRSPVSILLITSCVVKILVGFGGFDDAFAQRSFDALTHSVTDHPQ